jgi:hypothetical protein
MTASTLAPPDPAEGSAAAQAEVRPAESRKERRKR